MIGHKFNLPSQIKKWRISKDSQIIIQFYDFKTKSFELHKLDLQEVNRKWLMNSIAISFPHKEKS